MTPIPPLVFGYIHSVREHPERLAEAKQRLELWCARESWHLGATFTDVGSPLDLGGRVGFGGLVQALSLPRATAAVVLEVCHLSSRPDVVATLVDKIRRTGAAVWVRAGELPENALKLTAGQATWAR
ncbi:recombinase family protein [Actinokineospora sp. HUAS TT18]|uniref:recombinase family protein n=1 Tax=Actinokineospora sp. HUAS TT18 TaxID=3447451 RepID=UPI003F51D9ED